MKRGKIEPVQKGVLKCPTGIRGLDEITLGGLPEGRSTLICGNAGVGKTLLGMEFLVRGATLWNEPGVCVSFDETAEDLASNISSIGLDAGKLINRKKLIIDYIYLDRHEIEETGEYDLEGLFVRLGQAVDSIGAKRVLLDSIESLFAGLTDESILRGELRRLFRWLKEKHLTAIITGERGSEGRITRHGLEEYVFDCVISLDHRTAEGVSTRQLQILKYRGSGHGTNEYPFLIGADGLSVLPVTSLELSHPVSEKRVATGVPALDEMLGGKGYYKGSSVLISGTAGTGKTSIASHFVDAACARGERCIIFSFEESPAQIVRNMRSIGIDLKPWESTGLLRFYGSRPTTFGLETHLVKIHDAITEFKPDNVVIDPVTALLHAGNQPQTHSMLLRLIDFLKAQAITPVMTSLTGAAATLERSQADISSLIDVWILLRDIEIGGERNRGLYVLKARGIAHSHQIRELLLTDRGAQLRDCYLGEAGLLTGSARLSQEAKDATQALLSRQSIAREQALIKGKRRVIEARIAEMEQELKTGELQAEELILQEKARLQKWEHDRLAMAQSRRADRKGAAGSPSRNSTAKRSERK